MSSTMPDTTQGSAGLCDLCGADALEQVYRPEGSARGLTVHLCTHCGLVQSLPRIDHAPRRAASVSSGADWGNVRYGKGFRAAVAVDRLLPRLSGLDRPRVLDVGASRGAFIEAFRTVMPQAEITAVEPDTRVIGAYGADPSVTTIRERIEEVRLPEAQFDIVHSCHTLEHLRSPADTMRDHWRVLKPGGLLFAEVPSLAFLDAPDIV
ncbi:MAG: class I SAM-dependent methyltransferase [Alphaproteobacteria bacterium]|nr:class I SAM-dependent methyltransferase [Alphaproteobacteria bacterium]